MENKYFVVLGGEEYDSEDKVVNLLEEVFNDSSLSDIINKEDICVIYGKRLKFEKNIKKNIKITIKHEKK